MRFSPVGWAELTFHARKLAMSAETTIRAEESEYDKLAGDLRRPPVGHRPALVGKSGRISKLSIETSLPFGRSEVACAWIDQASGEALQGEKTVGGRKAYWKLWRYTHGGFIQWRAEPDGPRQKDLSVDEWTRRKLEAKTWERAPSQGAVVTDSYALIYLISAARLESRAAELALLVPDREKLVELRFRAQDKVKRKVSFEEVSSRGTIDRNGTVLAWRLVGTGRYLGGEEASSDVDTGFMGMKGGLTILVEEGTGLPIEICGRARFLGQVSVKLAHARLKD